MSQDYEMIVMATSDPLLEHGNYAYCSPFDIKRFCAWIPSHGYFCGGISKKKLFLAALQNDSMVLTLRYPLITSNGYLALNSSQRKTTGIVAGASIILSTFVPPPNFILDLIVIDINSRVKDAPQTEIDAIHLSKKLQALFLDQVMTTRQKFIVDYKGEEYDCIISGALIKGEQKGPDTVERGFVSKKTRVIFKTTPGHTIQIVNQIESTSRQPFRSDMDLQSLGLGGIRAQCKKLFTEVFILLHLPPYMRPGIKPVRGVLIHGLPGTGKTLLGRRIAEMFGNKGKFINCSDLFTHDNESVKMVKEFLIAVEKNQNSHGDHSDLHVLVLNDFDSIGREYWWRRLQAETNGSIVVELLNKSFNNVLFIAITNRKDLIDNSFLKHGRLQVQVDMMVQDEEGRLEILEIHASDLARSNMLAADVSLQDIASKANNFTGAELEGLVHSATRIMFQRIYDINGERIKHDSAVQTDVQREEVTNNDFLQAIREMRPIASVWEH
ncbi:hypothetical protein BUALT_Bualt19G0070400 [Buddleja alternifolia]|uniref:Vesicle-fusing ATPase n=1 Tax=Buddleja alternifolia TaxID=168488 RepID=A0AAV6W1Q1_9LAMI|nr:hypothetical protein BUALT_Bualt19G0070400 [Buddleja alternifolia]